jgi:DNA-directed RNA polymerase specialized sigma24 family protein
VHMLVGQANGPDVFFASEFPSLCRVAYLMVGDAGLAEEIVMEAFARTIGRWDRVRDADQPLAYQRQAVVNLSSSRIRRMAAERRANRRAGSPDVARWEADVASEAVMFEWRIDEQPSEVRAYVRLRVEGTENRREVRCEGGNPCRFIADLAPGEYVLTVSTRWLKGDVVHAIRLQVGRRTAR